MYFTPILLLANAIIASAQHEGQVLSKIQLVKSRHVFEDWIVGQPVSTSSGLVDGHPASNATEVSEYLGIPYAQPPIGDLRFQSPVKFNGTSIVNASEFGNSCIWVGTSKPANETWLEEIDATPLGTSIANASYSYLSQQIDDTSRSEDCLTLNIWTKPQTGETPKAVLIFIHPFESPSTSPPNPLNNPQWLVNNQDIILITLNYRLSIFGFPGNPLTSPNLGLLDIRLAIEWVRDNIHEFGGDSSRITLFGQGSGATLVDGYSFAVGGSGEGLWWEDPIVQGYILMSGTAVGDEPLTNETANGNWFGTSERLGCGGKGDNNTVVWNCMMGKKASDIVEAAALITTGDGQFGTWSTSMGGFGPTIDNVLIFGNYTDKVPVQAPILVGDTNDEADLWKLITPGMSNSSWEEFERLRFGCPAAWRAGVNARNGNPTWRYKYFAEFPNLRLFEGGGGSGSWHGSDVLLLFNNTPTANLPNTPQEIAFGKYFQGAWAAFAQDPFTGLSEYTAPNDTTQPWPEYNLTNRLSTIVRLGWHNQLGPNLVPAVNISTNGTSIGRHGTTGNSTFSGEDYDLGCPTSWPVSHTGGNGNDTTGTDPSGTATSTETSAVSTTTVTSTVTPTAGASSGGSSISGSLLGFKLSSTGKVERTLWVGLFVFCFAFFASQ